MSEELFDAERDATEHARFAHDDAAYVLAALDPEDLAAFENHLSGCPLCQAQVAELAGVPARLAAAAPDSWISEPPPASLLPGLLWRVESERRRRRGRTVLFAVVAACLLSVLSIGGFQLLHSSGRQPTHAFVSVAASGEGVRASATLTPSSHGTLLRVNCGHYEATGASTSPGYRPPDQSPETVYRLVVINRSGAQQIPTSWSPDRDITVDTSTNWPEKAISVIEIQDDHGTPILRLKL